MQEDNIIQLPLDEPRYMAKEVSYSNGTTLNSFMFIVKKQGLFNVEDTPYSQFFFSTKVAQRSIETQKKTYARAIVPFLNYIFIDSPNKIKDMSDLTLELCIQYMYEFSYGHLNETLKAKSRETISKVDNSLRAFLKWLYYNPHLTGIKLKHFKKVMFDEKPMFIFNYPPEQPPRPRLEDLTTYGVLQLIRIAEEFDPMLAFPITLQAFCGLRIGDVCQLNDHRFTWVCSSWDFIKDKELLGELGQYQALPLNAYITLSTEEILRGDAKRPGGIKTHRAQPIHEGLLPIIKHMYDKHIILLRERGINNKYGSLVVDNWYHAMSTQTYMGRFQKLVEKLLERLEVLSRHHQLALETYLLMQKSPLTSHSLRFYYSNLMACFVSTPYLLAFYRGDKSPKSVFGYISRTCPTMEQIAKIQNSLLPTFQEVFGLNLQIEWGTGIGS